MTNIESNEPPAAQSGQRCYRKLGRTGMDLCTAGFGMWQIAGGRWQSPNDKECVTMLQDAADRGINVFDAAVVYGRCLDETRAPSSRALELLGKAFHDRRDQIYYCIKLGQFDEWTHRACYEPRRLVEQFLSALQQLKTDYIDICLVHAPSLREVQRGNAISVLQTLQALGHVRAIGYSFENEPDLCMTALSQTIDVMMLQYNLLETECGPVFDEAYVRGIGILVGGGLKRGYLSGKYLQRADLPMQDDEYWRWNVRHNPGKVDDLLGRVVTLIEQHGSAAALRREAFRFILQNRAVASVVIGHRSTEEIADNIEAVCKNA